MQSNLKYTFKHFLDTPSENAQTNASTIAYQNPINMEDLTSPGVFTFGNTFISERDLNNRDLPDCLFQGTNNYPCTN